MSTNQLGAHTRPLLGGWSHGLAIAPATLGAIVLVVRTGNDPRKQLSFVIYGVALVLLFVVSALYHGHQWTPAQKARLRRIDQSNVFLMIAGTYTPIMTTVLSGWTILVALLTVWGMALTGIVLVCRTWRLHRLVPTTLYLGIGWVSLLIAPPTIARVGWLGFIYMVAGGVLYTLGATAYALRRPRLWPRVFGFHELFHVLVIAASVMFYVFMFREVAPLPAS